MMLYMSQYRNTFHTSLQYCYNQRCMPLVTVYCNYTLMYTGTQSIISDLHLKRSVPTFNSQQINWSTGVKIMMESQLWRMEISYWEQSWTLLNICTWTCKRHTQACHLSHSDSEGRQFSTCTTFINVAMTL